MASRKGARHTELTPKKITLALVFFPITIYMLVGTAVLFALYLFECAIHSWVRYAPFEGWAPNNSNDLWAATIRFIHKDVSTKYHIHDVWLTILFPLATPFMAILFLACMILVLFNAAVKTVWDFITWIFDIIFDVIKDIWSIIGSFFK